MSGQRILIVDDDGLMRALLSETLEEAGFSCVTAEDAMEAASALERGRFSLLLSDVDMPDLSGLSLARAVREWRPGLPVILMSGTGGSRVEEAFRSGAREFLEKPFSMGRAVAAVRTALR